MKKYEGLFIFPPEGAPQGPKGDEGQLEELIVRFGGRVFARNDWGRRPLGYSIKKFHEGRLLVWNFEMEGSQVGELKRALGLNERILKSSIFRQQELKSPEKPARAPYPSRATREPRSRREGGEGRDGGKS